MNDAWFAILGMVVMTMSVLIAGVSGATGPPEQRTWTPDLPDLEERSPGTGDGVATIQGQSYTELQAAINAASPGDTIELTGHFEERVHVNTSNITLQTAPSATESAHIDGGGEDTVIRVSADTVTLDGLWVSGSGPDRGNEDAGIFVNGSDVTVTDTRITEMTFGIWIHGGTDARITDNEIIGDPTISSDKRGNGVHLWRADGAEVRNNAMTQLRDGIYYQWSSQVEATGNLLWDLRYGVHYMYSDHNRLSDNLAYNNDVGFALMVSENLTITDNVAIDNRQGPSQHGILVKDIDDSEIAGNDLVRNGNGLYVYNAHNNVISDNLFLENHHGIQFTAGSSGERVFNNSFMYNERSVLATQTSSLSAWNTTDRGNYWTNARVVDIDGDGSSEVRHRPTGKLETVLANTPGAGAFASSPAVDAMRLAENSFPLIQGTGIVDERPLTQPPHDYWRDYYEHHN